MSAKVAFLTGGSSGIGQAVVKQLEAGGWRVIAPSHQELDLADLEKVSKFVESSAFPANTIDAFVHVAGVWHEQDKALADTPLKDFSAKEIADTMNVGVTAPMLLINKLLAAGRCETIVGISGTFEDGGAGWLPYYTSKRALEDFLVGLAQDSKDIKVYGVSPADTATPAYKRFYPEYAASAQSPEAVAQLVLLLFVGQSNHPSGSIIELRDGEAKESFHA